jgi:DNA-directed RNA polymerase specialized sigma24 family protein
MSTDLQAAYEQYLLNTPSAVEDLLKVAVRFVLITIKSIDPNIADTEDLSQQCVLGFWRGLKSYDSSRGDIAKWLAGICRHKVTDWKRPRYVTPPMAQYLPDVETMQTEPPAYMDWSRITNLPLEVQSIARLLLAGHTVQEIAATLGTTADALESKLSRLRRRNIPANHEYVS